MKIYLISDIHLMPPGQLSHGVIDTAARLQRALDDLAAKHADADLCILLGDLADHGDVEAYQVLRDKLASVKTPLIVAIGNHDSRANFASLFPHFVAMDGYVHYVRDTPFGRLIVMDTHQPNYASGRLDAARLAWLEEKLAEAKDQPVYLFLHHPPFDTGSRVDGLKLIEAKELGDRLAAHGNVRHIICGHTHRTCSGVWRGMPFTNLGATTYNIGLHPQGAGWGQRELGPSYAAVMLLSDDNMVIHHHDIRADNSPVLEEWSSQARLDEIIARQGRLD